MTASDVAERAAVTAHQWRPERLVELVEQGVLDHELRLNGLVAIQNLLAERNRLLAELDAAQASLHRGPQPGH